jgi:hypothetical protein
MAPEEQHQESVAKAREAMMATPPNGEVWSLPAAMVYLLTLIQGLEKRIVHADEAYQQRFEAQEKATAAALSAQRQAIDAALVATERAVSKAEMATEKRFESVNEFRQTLDNQQRTLATRTEVEVEIRGIKEKIEVLQGLVERSQASRSGIQLGWGIAIAAVGFIFMLIAAAIKYGNK